jgi:hypothetical protein|tara:strand:- start:163 stop:1470 length:1308 start_codon:yes stop_codon:yes gene_type:complete
MESFLTKKSILFIALTFVITSCGGGGGGGGSSDAAGVNSSNPPTVSISANPEKLYLGFQTNATVSYNYSNSNSCSGSGSLPSSSGGPGSGGGTYSFSASTAGTFTFTLTCTNSGGSTSASATIIVFERYYKQTEVVTNKNWDAEGFATITEGMFLGNGFLTNFDYSGTSDYLLTVTAFEPSDTSFELDYSGSTADGNSFDFSLIFNDWNTSATLLYDPDDSENAAFAFIRATYADAVVDGFLTLPDYFATQGIEYVSSALVEIFTNPSYYVIPTNVGEFTKSDDVPTTGTSSKRFDTLGYYYEASVEAGNQFAGYVVADGQGTLDFNFDNNTVSGSLTYDTFVPYSSFKDGTGTYNLITSIPDQTITLQNGTISDNSFLAEIVINDGETIGAGLIKGHFYGPNAEEIGVNIILLDNDDNENDYFIFTAGGIGQTE